MIEFQCDYAEGAHPRFWSSLVETNMDQPRGMVWILIVTRQDV